MILRILDVLDDDFNLNGRVQRKHRNTDRRACVRTSLTKDLTQQFGGAVDHAGLTGKFRQGRR